MKLLFRRILVKLTNNNKLRSKCSQKPINEAKILAQLEKELLLPLAVSDDML